MLPMFEHLLDLLLPRRCPGCGRGGTLLCPRCGPRVPLPGRCPGCRRLSPAGLTHPKCRGRTAIDGLTALARYADPLTRGMLLDAKFRGVRGYVKALGSRLGAEWRGTGLRRPAALVPVPLHWTRERARGFNQAALLAASFGRAVGLPVEPVLRRRRRTRPQSALDDHARIRNLQNAFRVSGPVPSRVILVDDIATSGATLDAAARALRDAGCSWVEGAVVASELPER